MVTIDQIEKEILQDKSRTCPRVGQRVSVSYEILEGTNKRVQIYEGLVIAVKHGSNRITFTVRKEAVDKVGVERIFPLYSPFVKEIVVKKMHKIRRAKLYYQRDLRGKSARLKERR